MKKANFNLILGVFFAFAVCMMTSCEKEKAVGKIQGLVTNANTNEPIQGVNISLSPMGASAVTGSDGRYEFTNLEAGNYTVQGVKNGFESNTKNITITAGNVSSGDMQLRPVVNGFRLNVEYLDFSTNFSQLQFKIINASATLPLSWEIMESMNWMTVTPSTGNLQGGQESTITVNIDRSLIEQSVTANLTVRPKRCASRERKRFGQQRTSTATKRNHIGFWHHSHQLDLLGDERRSCRHLAQLDLLQHQRGLADA